MSDAAAAAETLAPGHGADALVWEELESRARVEAVITVSFLAFMAVAAIIAGVGILLDSPILVIGAMVVGPEYGPSPHSVSPSCGAGTSPRGVPQ